MRRGQKWVAAASIAVAVISVIIYAFYRFQGMSLPAWDEIALAYGLVFCIFLFFDSAAKSVSRARSERRASEPQRPRPGPNGRPEREVAPVAGPSLQTRVRLVRVQEDWEGFGQRMAECMTEVFALDEQRPPVDEETGKVVWSDARDWQGQPQRHPFAITVDGQVVGACGVELAASGEAWLVGVYIDPAWRRKRAGSAAIGRLAEFLALTGTQAVNVRLSGQNRRGEQFVKGNGFREAGSGAPTAEGAPMGKVWRKSLG